MTLKELTESPLHDYKLLEKLSNCLTDAFKLLGVDSLLNDLKGNVKSLDSSVDSGEQANLRINGCGHTSKCIGVNFTLIG